MSHTQAIIAITALVVVLVVGAADYLVAPYSGVIPEGVVKLASAILIGVAIAAIVSGLRNGNGRSNGGS